MIKKKANPRTAIDLTGFALRACHLAAVARSGLLRRPPSPILPFKQNGVYSDHPLGVGARKPLRIAHQHGSRPMFASPARSIVSFTGLGAKARVLFALLFVICLVIARPAAGENSCVDCHKKAETISSLQPWQADSYFSWKSSVHGQKGVTCNKCHGGDSTQVKKNLAHQGVLNASHSNSMIFYKNVPKTCSPCHQKIYEGFAQSKHYQSLKEDKMVPTCTTCHGFHMGIGVANLYELASKCAVCHNERSKIYPKVPADVDEILAMTQKIEETLVRTEYTIELARERRQEIKQLQDRLKAVKVEWNRVSPLWHTFDLELIKREAKATLKEVDQVYSQSKEIFLKKK